MTNRKKDLDEHTICTPLWLLFFLLFILANPASVFGQSKSAADVELNHIYVVLDKLTFDRLLASEFFQNEFAAIDAGLPTFKKPIATDQVIYVRGEKTYLELLGPENRFNEPVGKVGIGFSVETKDSLAEVRQKIESQDLIIERYSQKSRRGFPKPVDWFDAIYLKSEKPATCAWWISETDPDFLASLYPDRPSLHGRIDRSSFLSPVYDPAKCFKGIAKISLQLPIEEKHRLIESLSKLGFEIDQGDDFIRLQSPSLTLQLKDQIAPNTAILESIGFQANGKSSRRISEVIAPGFAVHVDADGFGQIAFAITDDMIRHEQSVRRENCFPIERLPEDLQELSKKILLEALDSEALYTIVGNLKPVSEGFYSTYIDLENLDPAELKKVEQALSAWQCGSCFEAGTLPFNNVFNGRRYVSAWIANRAAVTNKINSESTFFTKLGLSEQTPVQSLMISIERAKSMDDRWRGFGLLFGYPRPAVDFFVRAGMHQARTGEFVERDFRNFPTHQRASGNFVYAVPKLTPETDSEREVRKRVDAILTQYRSLRQQRIENNDPTQVVELLRDFFDDGTRWCHPNHAVQKVERWTKAKNWVAQNAIKFSTTEPGAIDQELSKLDAIIAKPRIVALGESTHGTREFFQLKHRIFKHLAEQHGVRLFGIESSFAACLPINRYIQTGEGDPKDFIRDQGFWTWNTEEVLDLVEWMRQWNANPEHRNDRVMFYGFDTQDSFTPIEFLLRELEKWNPESVSKFRTELSSVLTHQYDHSFSPASEDIDQLKTLIERILVELNSTQNQRTPSANLDIELAAHQARSALEIDRPQNTQNMASSKAVKTNVRDKTMATMVKKILDGHGDSSRIVLWAHDWHVSKFEGQPNLDTPRMGTFLESMYRGNYVPVGFSFGSGGFQAKYFPDDDEDSANRILRNFVVRGSRYDSYSQLFQRVEAPAFAIDFPQTQPEKLPSWFAKRRANRSIGAIFQPSKRNSSAYYEQVILPRHFELIIHVQKTNAAIPLGPVPKVFFGTRLKKRTDKAIIQSVANDSLAKRSGLRVGDQITKFGDAEIRTNDDFQQALSDLKRGGTIEIHAVRNPGAATAKPLILFATLPAWVGAER